MDAEDVDGAGYVGFYRLPLRAFDVVKMFVKIMTKGFKCFQYSKQEKAFLQNREI
jgi:hypothetical protein